MDYVSSEAPTAYVEAHSAERVVDTQQEARAFLIRFAANYAQSPHDGEQLQAGIDMSASSNCPIPRSERSIVMNQVLRYFEHRVRRSAGSSAETHELLVKLSQNLFALDERFTLAQPEQGRV